MKHKIINLTNIALIITTILLLYFLTKENLVLKSNEKIEKLHFIEDEIRIKQNEKIKPGLNITPNDLENYELKFSSKNEKIATINEKGEIIPKKPGKTTITVSTNNKKLKDSLDVTVLKEYLFFIGDSNWELIEGKRNGGDTKKPYEINFRNYEKDKNLFFISKSGAGLSWIKGSIPDYMKENGYAKRDEEKDSSEDMKNIIKEHEEAYFKIIIGLGTNDIKFVSSKEMAEEYGKLYAEFYNELARELPEEELIVYSIIPIGKPDSCKTYDENDYTKDEHRNKKVEAFNESVKNNLKEENLKYVDIYSYFSFLSKQDKICFSPDGHWNKDLTQKVYDKVLEKM